MVPYVVKWTLRSNHRSYTTILSCGHGFTFYREHPTGTPVPCPHPHERWCSKCSRPYTMKGLATGVLSANRRIDMWCWGCVQTSMGGSWSIDPDTVGVDGS